jgi:hypothetical protein
MTIVESTEEIAGTQAEILNTTARVSKDESLNAWKDTCCSISRVFPGRFSQDFKPALHVCLQTGGVDRISPLHLFQKSYERTAHTACAVCPQGIGGYPFEARQQHADEFLIQFGRFHGKAYGSGVWKFTSGTSIKPYSVILPGEVGVFSPNL